MSSFDGRLHMPGQSRIPLGVEVDIANERMTLSTGDRRIGDWALKDVDISAKSDGFHLRLDDEEVVLSVAESDRFLLEVGCVARPPAVAQTTLPGPVADSKATLTGRRGRLSITPDEHDFDEIKRRVARLSTEIASDELAPAEVFGQWIRLLKEINLKHGQGAMPTPLFYRLNTQLLDLIPEPARPHPTRA
ncbi:MAG: hypothetical protein PVF87_00040 [Acidimicrobiia bacterium]|jgi:hypothetical protein